MKRTLALLIGLALVVSAITVSAQQGSGRGRSKGAPANAPCTVGQGKCTDQKCPNYGTCPNQGQGKGKGFRGGARDGSGPKRDGSGGLCPNKS